MPIDYSKYPPDWKEIRARILDRAGNKCEICGVRNYSKVIRKLNKWNEKEIKIVLTIAHLDHDETNHNVKDDRLMAMCQRCHIKYDALEKWNRKCWDMFKRKRIDRKTFNRYIKTKITVDELKEWAGQLKQGIETVEEEEKDE